MRIDLAYCAELDQTIDLITTNPRQTLNLDIPKMEVGELANLTLFSPTETQVVKTEQLVSKSKNSPFIGKTKNLFHDLW